MDQAADRAAARGQAGATGFAAFREGAAAAWPICLGYMFIGLAFGVIAQKAGLSPFEVFLMSVMVFAGSAQFIGVSMIAGGASPLMIAATTAIVNLRHVLMSSALSVHLQGRGRGFLSLFAYGVTDESFAVNLTRFRDGYWTPGRALALNHTANATWVAATVAGAYGGEFVPPGALGSDYALMGMFLCLLAFQLRARIHAVTAILSGGLALLFSLVIPGNSHVILATLLGATAGFRLSRQRARREAP